jgi:hypothetical protein
MVNKVYLVMEQGTNLIYDLEDLYLKSIIDDRYVIRERKQNLLGFYQN